MIADYARLLHRLIDGCAPRTVGAPHLTADLTDTLARLTIVSSTQGRLDWLDGRTVVDVDRNLRDWATRHPNAVWAAELSAAQRRGTLVPFCPPRVLDLDAQVPVRMSPEMASRLAATNLAGAVDLARDGAVRVTSDLTVAFLGQSSLASEESEDAERLTWWLRNGVALELTIVRDEANGTTLELLDVVREGDPVAAPCLPNTLVQLGRQARILFDRSGTQAPAPASLARELTPRRSALLDAWARYARVQREELDDKQRRRALHPIRFHHGSASGRLWRAQAQMEDPAVAAWLGTPKDMRRVKIDQPVASKDGDTTVGDFTLAEAQIRGPGLVDLFLRARGETRVLPEAGRLEAVDDKGSRRKDEREREAMDCLARGLAACEHLPARFAAPESAVPPEIAARLPAQPLEALDDDQSRAVKMILGCQEIVVIQGPPGTGKTRVIAEALHQIAARARQGRGARVLVSSVQNEAVLNVLERLSNTEGVVFHVIQRSGSDEDEQVEFARRRIEQGQRVADALGNRHAASPVLSRLRVLDEATSEVDRISSALAIGPAAESRTADMLDDLAKAEGALVGRSLQTRAARIATRMRTPVAPASTAPCPIAPVPADPDVVSTWWTDVQDAWPAVSRGAVAMAVAGIAEALRRPAAARALLLDRACRRLEELVANTPLPSSAAVSAPPDEIPDTSEVRTEALKWVADTKRFLADRRAEVLVDPDAIAVQFLQALREDPAAWTSIVERHGNAVAATCSMSAKARLEPGEAYDWVIVDEAGRASPFELLVPLVQGKRIVLIGDHRQLPPMVDDAVVRRVMDDAEDVADLREDTLFGALYHLLPAACVTRLATQYRMHGKIGQLVNDLFYQPHGEPIFSYFEGDRVASRTSRLGVFDDRPLVWVEVPRSGPVSTEENVAQAERVMSIVREFAEAGAGPGHVAIICPYVRQRAHYDRLLVEPALKDVCQVKTIDAVQGREYPVVILDLVRNDGRAGFLASPNRLNVAVSRAQQQLIVVGNASRLVGGRIEQRAPHLARLVRTLSNHRGTHR